MVYLHFEYDNISVELAETELCDIKTELFNFIVDITKDVDLSEFEHVKFKFDNTFASILTSEVILLRSMENIVLDPPCKVWWSYEKEIQNYNGKWEFWGYHGYSSPDAEGSEKIEGDYIYLHVITKQMTKPFIVLALSEKDLCPF